jgi:hypothetical protein
MWSRVVFIEKLQKLLSDACSGEALGGENHESAKPS